MPVSMFLEYKQELNTRRGLFDGMVGAFLDNYDMLVSQAQTHLGNLFDPGDYPDVDVVARKFGFKTVFSPVPESGDFRLDTNAVDIEELKEQYDAAYSARLNDAMQSAWDTLHNLLSRMSEKLVEPEGEKAKVFHKTFLTNAQELCSLLTHLNITKDAQLERARQDLEKMLFGADIADIRETPGARADMKVQVDAVLAKYEW